MPFLEITKYILDSLSLHTQNNPPQLFSQMLAIGRHTSRRKLAREQTDIPLAYLAKPYTRAASGAQPGDLDFSKILVLHKVTRYEFEKRRNPALSEQQLKSLVY